ncbi:IMPACT family protein [Granulicoccus phenolivorans]|uniref:IMPACT family protein n=1 Tax=Granulicoccus phenolivorans TaxID=266854 RepID=UPI0004237BF8|nr:YigZ family protein [Granulicoccus phenolivorans]
MKSGPSAYTVLGTREVVTEIEIKRSIFRAHLRRVGDEDGARELVAELRRTHHDARHHCSAFVLGPGRDVQRSNDDGEPAGTAGIPMLEALTKRITPEGQADLSDVCAVVVRWFGGIKLGAGGLVRAYTEAVTTALDAAPLVRRVRSRLFTLDLGYPELGTLEAQLRNALTVADVAYGPESARLTLSVPDADDAIAEAVRTVAALTAGAYALTEAGTTWQDT